MQTSSASAAVPTPRAPLRIFNINDPPAAGASAEEEKNAGSSGEKKRKSASQRYEEKHDVPLYDRAAGLVLGSSSFKQQQQLSKPKDVVAAVDRLVVVFDSKKGKSEGDLPSAGEEGREPSSSFSGAAADDVSGWSRCFNCGSYAHSLRECPRPKNRAAIAAARAEHAAKQGGENGVGGGGGRSERQQQQQRYHDGGGGGSARRRRQFEGLEEGSLCPELREALGLQDHDPPPWQQRMWELGSPPHKRRPSPPYNRKRRSDDEGGLSDGEIKEEREEGEEEGEEELLEMFFGTEEDVNDAKASDTAYEKQKEGKKGGLGEKGVDEHDSREDGAGSEPAIQEDGEISGDEEDRRPEKEDDVDDEENGESQKREQAAPEADECAVRRSSPTGKRRRWDAVREGAAHEGGGDTSLGRGRAGEQRVSEFEHCAYASSSHGYHSYMYNVYGIGSREAGEQVLAGASGSRAGGWSAQWWAHRSGGGGSGPPVAPPSLRHSPAAAEAVAPTSTVGPTQLVSQQPSERSASGGGGGPGRGEEAVEEGEVQVEGNSRPPNESCLSLDAVRGVWTKEEPGPGPQTLGGLPGTVHGASLEQVGVVEQEQEQEEGEVGPGQFWPPLPPSPTPALCGEWPSGAVPPQNLLQPPSAQEAPRHPALSSSVSAATTAASATTPTARHQWQHHAHAGPAATSTALTSSLSSPFRGAAHTVPAPPLPPDTPPFTPPVPPPPFPPSSSSLSSPSPSSSLPSEPKWTSYLHRSPASSPAYPSPLSYTVIRHPPLANETPQHPTHFVPPLPPDTPPFTPPVPPPPSPALEHAPFSTSKPIQQPHPSTSLPHLPSLLPTPHTHSLPTQQVTTAHPPPPTVQHPPPLPPPASNGGASAAQTEARHGPNAAAAAVTHGMPWQSATSSASAAAPLRPPPPKWDSTHPTIHSPSSLNPHSPSALASFSTPSSRFAPPLPPDPPPTTPHVPLSPYPPPLPPPPASPYPPTPTSPFVPSQLSQYFYTHTLNQQDQPDMDMS